MGTKYIQRRLTPSERIVYTGHVSWVPLMINASVAFVVTSAIAGVIWGITSSVGYMGLTYVIAIVIWTITHISEIIHNASTEMVVTNSHLHSKTGLIRIENDREATLERVDRVDIDMHSIVQRLFDYGDIEFQTMGSDSGFFYFRNVAHPYAMKDAYDDARVRHDRELRAAGIDPNEAVGSRVGSGQGRNVGGSHDRNRRRRG